MSLTVVIVAPVHIWDDVRVFKKQAVSLAAAGFSVKLIARIDKFSVIDGVTIIPPAGSYASRFLRFLSLSLVAFQALKLKGEVYHLHNPDTIPIAILLRLFGQKVIYDTHEDFTQRILLRLWLPKPFRRLVAWLIGKTESMTSALVNASIATQPDVASRMGSKCNVIENPPRFNEELMKKVEILGAEVGSKECKFRLIYIGAIGSSRGLDEMVDALYLINKELNCRLWLIGPASEGELDSVRKKEGWEFVDYYHRMPQEMAFSYVAKADVGLIYMNDVGGHSKTDPNKIYEYMAFSKPFIASDFEKWRLKLDSVQAGVFVKPGSAIELAKSVLFMSKVDSTKLEIMGRNGLNYVKENNWDKSFEKLLTIYSEIEISING